MSNKFTYQKRGYETAQKRTSQGGTAREGFLSDHVRQYTPKEGSNSVRILPPTWDNPDHYAIDVYVHYGIGADNSAYLCPNKMFGKRCPICEARDRANAKGDKDYADKLKPNKRVLAYVIDRDNESDGIKLWAMPWTVDKDIMIQSTSEKTRELLAIDDPENGYDVNVKREGKAEKTKYVVSIDRNSSEIDITDAMEKILLEHPLPTVLVEYSYEHLEKSFNGQNTAALKEQAAAKTSNVDKKLESKTEEEPEQLTWESVHGLQFEELDEVCESLGLDIDSSDLSLKDYAAKVCEELNLKNPKDDSNSRLSKLQNLRNRKSS